MLTRPQRDEALAASPFAVSRVEPRDLMVVWPSLLPQIRKGLRKGCSDSLTERKLFLGVASREMDLWVMHDGDEILAGLFLQTLKRERGTALFIVDVVAGSGRGFSEYAKVMLPRIREYGNMIGAYTIESISRPGAARLLQRLGCKVKATVMELKDGQ